MITRVAQFAMFGAALSAPALAQTSATASAAADQALARPFGTLRDQAGMQQDWLARRLTTVLPALMRKHGVEFWVVPMREYNEDPVFASIVSPTTFAARRRTIYIFHDTCARRAPGAGTTAATPCGVERIALGGTSQGGLYDAVRSTQAAAGPAGARGQQQAELWGDEQWVALRKVIVERNPRTITVNVSRNWAFADGLSAGEYLAMREAMGPQIVARLNNVEMLAVELIAARLPEEEAVFRRMQEVVWGIIDTAFSNAVITPGVTTTQDVVWWMRQKVNDLGLGSWFQPSVSVQRLGVSEEQLGADPVIQRGDVLHCDFGIVAHRLNTDTQHMGYVLREGETDVPLGIQRALWNSNRLQDIVMSELRAGRSGNEILASSRKLMQAAGIDGTIYSHPIGMHGHGAGPMIGMWDRQDGIPGRGDAKVIPNMWYSIELQATTEVPEWNNQRVRSAQEEDAIVGDDGVARWALGRQTKFWVVR